MSGHFHVPINFLYENRQWARFWPMVANFCFMLLYSFYKWRNWGLRSLSKELNYRTQGVWLLFLWLNSYELQVILPWEMSGNGFQLLHVVRYRLWPRLLQETFISLRNVVYGRVPIHVWTCYLGNIGSLIYSTFRQWDYIPE